MFRETRPGTRFKHSRAGANSSEHWATRETAHAMHLCNAVLHRPTATTSGSGGQPTCCILR
eukprot:2027192-Pyramimonas_sp.AAC.1